MPHVTGHFCVCHVELWLLFHDFYPCTQCTQYPVPCHDFFRDKKFGFLDKPGTQVPRYPGTQVPRYLGKRGVSMRCQLFQKNSLPPFPCELTEAKPFFLIWCRQIKVLSRFFERQVERKDCLIIATVVKNSLHLRGSCTDDAPPSVPPMYAFRTETKMMY